MNAGPLRSAEEITAGLPEDGTSGHLPRMKRSLPALLLALVACHDHAELTAVIPEAEMIFWEKQSWETGGGSNRLTLWADGRSEVTVIPGKGFPMDPEEYPAREGWTQTQERDYLSYTRQNVFSKEVVQQKIRDAMAAEMHLLETFQPNYVDGGGVFDRRAGRRRIDRNNDSHVHGRAERHTQSPAF